MARASIFTVLPDVETTSWILPVFADVNLGRVRSDRVAAPDFASLNVPTLVLPMKASTEPQVGQVNATIPSWRTVRDVAVVSDDPLSVALEPEREIQPLSVVRAQADAALRIRARSSRGTAVQVSADHVPTMPRDV